MLYVGSHASTSSRHRRRGLGLLHGARRSTGYQRRHDGGHRVLQLGCRQPGRRRWSVEYRFERLVGEADAAAPAVAAAKLREALGLWRGPALAEFAYESFAQATIGRLEELRLAALENDEEGWTGLPRALPWARLGWPFRPQEREAARQRSPTSGQAVFTVSNEYNSFFMMTV